MPFTPAHAALAAPLYWLGRGRLPAAGLIVGTLAPDFEYFIHQEAVRPWAGHSAAGLFYFCLPAGWLVLGLFRAIQPGLAALFPAWGQWTAHPSRRGFWATSWALVLGAASHTLWDAFTHRDGWGTLAWPDLLLTPLWGPLPPYKWLQYGGGVVGLGCCAGWFIGISWRYRPTVIYRYRGWIATWALIGGLTLGLAALRYELARPRGTEYALVVAAMTVFAAGVALVAAYRRVYPVK